MRILISSYKLLLVSLLAVGCVSVGSEGRSPSTVAASVENSTAKATPSSAPTPTDLGELQPGIILRSDGKAVDDGGHLEIIMLEAESGILTVGVWTSLQEDLTAYFKERPEFYAKSTIKVSDENFVRVIPIRPLTTKLTKTPDIMPAPGLAYANARGELLISLTDARPPDGFVIIGQASVAYSALEVWKARKDGVEVIMAGGMRA